MAEVITRFKVDSGQFDRKVKDAQKQLDGFASSLGVNMKAFTKMGAAAAAAGAALKVVGDAFKKNESIMDDWRANIEGAKGVYSGFLNALNTGDMSGFVKNMSTIASAARDAYDALDALGTFNAFNRVNLLKARTGLTEAITGYKEGTVDIAGVNAAADALKTELSTRQSFEKNAYYASIVQKAKETGVDEDLLKKALLGDYGTFESLKALKMPTKQVWNSSTRSMISVVDRDAASAQEKLGDMLRRLNDEELDAIQQLGETAQMTAYEIAQVDKQVQKLTSSSKKDKGSKWKNPYKHISSIKSSSEGISVKPVDVDGILNNANFSALSDSIDRMNAGTQYAKAQAFELADAWKQAANCIAMAGSAMQGIESPAARVTGILAEAIANIALGFGAAAANQGKSGNVWEWIAASISGAATMISTIAAVKQATKGYAQGGIVGSLGYGMSSSGDNIVARLNKGEGVLTRAGIDNAETLFSGGSIGGLFLETRVSGEDLAIVLDNNNRRRGRGKTIR